MKPPADMTQFAWDAAQREGYVTEIEWHHDPTRRAWKYLIYRQIAQAHESIDLAEPSPWVRFRRALQGRE